MRFGPVIAAFLVSLATVLTVRAGEDRQAEKPAADRGPKLGEPDVQKWKIGMIVSASGGSVGRLTGTTTVPVEWPEQSVKIVGQDLSPGVTLSYKSFGTAKQMVVSIPRVADGKEVHAILTDRGHAATLLPPDETDLYVVPDAKSLPPDFKQYLNPSPLIESNHMRIKAIAKQLGEGQTKAWDHVRAIYDWVRKTIQYKKDAPSTGCVEAIDQQQRRLQPVDFDVHRHLPGQRHSSPHRPDPRALLSGILSARRQGPGALVPGRGIGHGCLWRHLHAHADLAEGRRLQHYRARYEPPPRVKTETFRLLPSNLASPNLKPATASRS